MKAGLRVRVYATLNGAVAESNGTVRSLRDDGMLVVDLDSQLKAIVAHPKQCRRLVLKPRRRVWIYGPSIGDETIDDSDITFDAEKQIGSLGEKLRAEWVEFIEARRKK